LDKLGISFGGGLSPTQVVEYARQADQLGYHSVWMSEGNGSDNFSVFTACALATKNVQLGTSISSVFVRTAPIIAMAAACVDHFSQGRFILGLGSSHKVQVEGQHGLAYARPLSRVRETVEIVRELLKEGSVSYKGQVISIDSFGFAFPVYRKEMPIYLAAVFPKMLQTTGQMAQGVILTQNTPDTAREAVIQVAQGARAAGRDPKDVEIISMVACAVTSDPTEARNDIRRSLAYTCGYYPRYNRSIARSGFAEEAAAIRSAWQSGDQKRAQDLVTNDMIDAFAIIGSREECRDRLQEHRQAGVTIPILTFRAGGTRLKESMMGTIKAMAPA
jgi:alkanesulfonate monooxygenase SsuD/methylene tetrahydromethanopterin reductase-like flavin-dependent oxidoreductase (luciferase family)